MNSAPRRKPRTFRFKRYQVPKYIKDALATLKPPDDITVSQWAERNRILSRKESNLQGYWRNSVTPYLTGIMDEFNNWETEQIIFVKPTQCGGTEGELNIWDYPIYLDVEYEPYNTGKDGSGRSRTQVKADNTAIIKAALDVFEKAGYYAAVYCSRDFFLNYTNLGNLAGFDKWEAAYTRSDTAAVENGLWQYSSKNALGIAGFGSSLDCDVSYKDYPDIMKRCGLNGYIKTPASSTGNTNGEKLQTPTVGPMSKGDFDRIVNQAAALGKAPTEYTVRLAPMATTQAAQIKATANELGIPYLSAWVEG